ncbi:NADH-quinone oxidoreductase subunit NuoK [Coxiella endosymbiont of Rhipicephalus microplus]|uniref:NADH-quinone oxidoreductase subunit NuoK n=1 Tax=Coxiella endosymbiont of Rhipicephalus microplus TaxID=1656186 RepID=UPI000C807FB5|nr:NADH-quinone oxidoreductase subunit NuoK [Coxiella endosymbiont of Rhipicephalus microplus]PMB54697.1 NADH-ubiquinone oxidoreductase chain K [Coxiella-like endosymbiont]
MIPLSYFLIIGAILFGLGCSGIIINRKNLIVLLMCIELMLLAVNTNFITFAQYLGVKSGEIFVFFILTVAAAESAIGLAILVLFYRRRGTIHIDDMKILKG